MWLNNALILTCEKSVQIFPKEQNNQHRLTFQEQKLARSAELEALRFIYVNVENVKNPFAYDVWSEAECCSEWITKQQSHESQVGITGRQNFPSNLQKNKKRGCGSW